MDFAFVAWLIMSCAFVFGGVLLASRFTRMTRAGVVAGLIVLLALWSIRAYFTWRIDDVLSRMIGGRASVTMDLVFYASISIAAVAGTWLGLRLRKQAHGPVDRRSIEVRAYAEMIDASGTFDEALPALAAFFGKDPLESGELRDSLIRLADRDESLKHIAPEALATRLRERTGLTEDEARNAAATIVGILRTRDAHG